MSNLLCDPARDPNNVEDGRKLIGLCPPEPTPGFHLLVRYVDTLCTMYNVPIVPLELTRKDGSGSIDLTAASIVAQGYKSLVLKIPGEDCVIKVSEGSRIRQEYSILEKANGTKFIPRRREGDQWRGSVLGAGYGLEWMILSGFGTPVNRDDLQRNFNTFWNQAATALAGLHSCGVFHRDIKPSNMLIVDNELWIHDFDCSCLVDGILEVRRLRVGTPYFESPLYDESHGFEYRDDWCFSFLDLVGFYLGEDKKSILGAAALAARAGKFPASFEKCVRWLLADKHGMFNYIPE